MSSTSTSTSTTTTAPVAVPVPEEVGHLYDRLTALDTEAAGGSLHLGYWDVDDNDTPLVEAADRLTDTMTDRLRIDQGQRVLDVGCGVGQPAMRIARRTGAHVTGIAISKDQIARATALAEGAGLSDRVEFRHADAMELPFPDNSFDAAIAIESIFHMPDRGRVLAEIRRVLRPGGRLVLTDFFERGPIPAEKQPAVDRLLRDFIMTLARPEDYVPMLRDAGLRFVELLDITEQSVRQTFEQMSKGSQEMQTVFDDEAEEKFSPASMIDVDEFGSVLLTAQKPL
ncbi:MULTISPECIES: cyclopropane-fatty-acyl-phospholipid synthase family protein [unclassified Streptomyces]|uniref:SAM-dependent methyltransferase n=1 Tax=unclassified Streptomyces TaxID=2593676 RepID=UPI00089C6668|nr:MULTISPECIES: methyltransferase domain-containing protein [unclassified Streptomyces]SEB73460.1 Methyltransferase domain-containing protein [Streptomyces sp. 2314.4]SOE15844.1 Methyltransferase domain-containing protein [Streptomyces sp. 2323.1]